MCWDSVTSGLGGRHIYFRYNATSGNIIVNTVEQLDLRNMAIAVTGSNSVRIGSMIVKLPGGMYDVICLIWMTVNPFTADPVKALHYAILV